MLLHKYIIIIALEMGLASKFAFNICTFNKLILKEEERAISFVEEFMSSIKAIAWEPDISDKNERVWLITSM